MFFFCDFIVFFSFLNVIFFYDKIVCLLFTFFIRNFMRVGFIVCIIFFVFIEFGIVYGFRLDY